MYTGDDFHYDVLIAGDDHGFSDALLGIFDPLAEFAAAAVRTIDEGDLPGFQRILGPTLPLSRHLFRHPTYFYKTGFVFLAYLNGHQNHFRMVGGQEGARSIVHLSELFRLADQVGLFVDPELAVLRMRHVYSRWQESNEPGSDAAQPESYDGAQPERRGRGGAVFAARDQICGPLARTCGANRSAKERPNCARCRLAYLEPLPRRFFRLAGCTRREPARCRTSGRARHRSPGPGLRRNGRILPG